MSDYIASELTADDKDSWSTPDWLFAALHQEFWFSIDAAASENNHKKAAYITEEMNALEMEHWADCWHGFLHLEHQYAWINPPYSRGMIKAFMEKAYEQCHKYKINSVLLVPATPDAGWWPKNATEIRFITSGRVSFIHPITKKSVNGNTKGSALIIFKYTDLGCGTMTRYVDRNKLREVGEMLLAKEEVEA